MEIFVSTRQVRQLGRHQYAQPAAASASPKAPPATPSSMLSSNSSARPGPILLPAPHERQFLPASVGAHQQQFATLAQAITAQCPTVPISTHSVLPISPDQNVLEQP